MSYSIQHRMGDAEDDPPLEALELLYDELFSFDDDEHGDVSVEHEETEICLIAYRSGLLIREDVAIDRSSHLKNVSRAKMLELWSALSRGDIDRLDREPWEAGY